jgi:hypothetical protein
MLETLSVRVTEEVAAILDEYVAAMQRKKGDDVVVSRSDAVRVLMGRGLRQWRSQTRRR